MTLKEGVFKSVTKFSKSKLDVVTYFTSKKLDSGCSACCTKDFDNGFKKLKEDIAQYKSEYGELLINVPLASINSPFGWNYVVIDLVTAQSTTGTGAFSDIASSWTDFFGMQSGVYNSKIKAGENICKASLRSQAAQLGANAVVGVDVDYAEVGGSSAMLMVCMTGTAVKLHDLSVLKDGDQGWSERLFDIQAKLKKATELHNANIVQAY